MNDFKRRKTLVLKGKFNILRNIVKNIQVLNGYPCKNVTKYFCIFFCFRTFYAFFFLRTKNLHYLAAERSTPPPLSRSFHSNRHFCLYVLYLIFSCIFCSLRSRLSAPLPSIQFSISPSHSPRLILKRRLCQMPF